MILSKYKYSVTISGGVGSFNTDYLKGEVKQLLVIPLTSTNNYSLSLSDRDGDVMYQNLSVSGLLDNRDILLIGRDSPEKITFSFTSVGTNEAVTVILRIKEK